MKKRVYISTSKYGDKYEGEMKDGRFHGQGKLTFADGREYIGEFKNGLRNGQGTLTTHDGDRYEGEWKEAGRDILWP